MGKFCTFCGKGIDPADAYCMFCGRPTGAPAGQGEMPVPENWTGPLPMPASYASAPAVGFSGPAPVPVAESPAGADSALRAQTILAPPTPIEPPVAPVAESEFDYAPTEVWGAPVPKHAPVGEQDAAPASEPEVELEPVLESRSEGEPLADSRLEVVRQEGANSDVEFGSEADLDQEAAFGSEGPSTQGAEDDSGVESGAAPADDLSADSGLSAEEDPDDIDSESDDIDDDDYSPTMVVLREKGVLVRKSCGDRFDVVPPCVLGRGSTCNVRIQGNQAVSRVHAKITKDDNGSYFIEDLCSTNNTFVDGDRLEMGVPHELSSGSALQLGTEDFEFVVERM